MKNYYLFFLLLAFFGFNQLNAEACPDAAIINGGGTKMTISYNDPINCAGLPTMLTTTGGAVWSLSNCLVGNDTAFYNLDSGTPPPVGGTFTIDTGFDTSCSYSDSVLPISDFELLNASLSVFPNPLMKNNILNLKFTLNTSAKIFIYNVTGKLVLVDEITNAENKQINTSALTNGIYMLKISTDNASTTRKVVIMK
jgi:hypothetical protein